MDTQEIVILVVAILVALAIIAAVVVMMRKRKHEQHRERADELRTEARHHVADDLPEAQVRAQKAEAEAEEARLEAERAEREAAEARTGVAQREAIHEDKVREADRLDPRVDHKSGDYEPHTTVPADDRSRTSDPDTILDADDQRREGSAQGDDDEGLPRRVRGANQMPGGVPKSEWGDNWFKRNPDGSPQLDADGNRVPEEGRSPSDTDTTDGGSHRA